MAIFSRFLSLASTNGFRLIKNTTGTRRTCLRAISSSSSRWMDCFIYDEELHKLAKPKRKEMKPFHGDYFPLALFVDVDDLMEHATMMPGLEVSELLKNTTLERCYCKGCYYGKILGRNQKKCYCYECYRFLKTEAKKRLAYLIKELHELPKELHAEPKFQMTMEKYCTSYMEVQAVGNNDTRPQVLQMFVYLLYDLRDRHQDTESNIAEACENVKEKFNMKKSMDEIQNRITISCILFEFWKKL